MRVGGILLRVKIRTSKSLGALDSYDLDDRDMVARTSMMVLYVQ